MSSLALWEYIGRILTVGGLAGIAVGCQPKEPAWHTFAGTALGLVTTGCGLYILKNTTTAE